MLPTPNQSVEDLIKTMPGVGSANELSSTYSVRGGNYDENLFTSTTSKYTGPCSYAPGNRKGSVSSIRIWSNPSSSRRRFDAVYGDKLSSVLGYPVQETEGIRNKRQRQHAGRFVDHSEPKQKRQMVLDGECRQRSNQYLLNTFIKR